MSEYRNHEFLAVLKSKHYAKHIQAMTAEDLRGDGLDVEVVERMVEGWNGAVDTLKAVRADLLLRAEMDMEDGGAILNISNGVLRKLDEAIAAFDAWQKGEE